jgi:hypothetical protein
LTAERAGKGEKTPAPAESANAPRLARPAVALFLVAMLAAAAFLWEPWPITSFRLFSHQREDRQQGWAATLAGVHGDEAPLALTSLSPDFRGFGFRMAEFETASRQRRDEICRTWVEPLTVDEDREPAVIRLYRLSWRLSRRTADDERPLPPRRQLAFVCTAAGAWNGAPG